MSLTERISKQHGLNLNRDKCVALAMSNDGSIHFQDGTQLAKGFEAAYLGNEINEDVNIPHEVVQRIRGTLHMVQAQWYWKASRASKRWKLIVCDAIIRSILLYGLATIHLTQSLSKKLDAFQFRCIRKILGMSLTFINRTNKKLLETATVIAFSEHGDRRKIVSFSDYHWTRRAKLLGHVLRSNSDDSLRQISFLPQSAMRVEYGKRRCGRPRQNWLHTTKKHVYEHTLGHFK